MVTLLLCICSPSATSARKEDQSLPLPVTELEPVVARAGVAVHTLDVDGHILRAGGLSPSPQVGSAVVRGTGVASIHAAAAVVVVVVILLLETVVVVVVVGVCVVVEAIVVVPEAQGRELLGVLTSVLLEPAVPVSVLGSGVVALTP
ncbi:hypothetical protein EGW08_016074 [Elysia chlorotica]|uniref:Secreted protein n=1 Tax=Elysia chlorotica TaxID=188477 RepID=A0A3S0ZVD5_ELYCH|nr:hypothetical protein EGW08_016074 [Elysia chlorotica]